MKQTRYQSHVIEFCPCVHGGLRAGFGFVAALLLTYLVILLMGAVL